MSPFLSLIHIYSLDLSGFIGSQILGGIILAIYTGSLAYVGAKTGLSLDLLA